MAEAMYPEQERVCRRRRLMYKQTVPEGVFGGFVPRDAGMDVAACGAEGSHAPLLAFPVLPEAIPEMQVPGPLVDVPVGRVHEQRRMEFSRATYNRVYGRIARWVSAQQNEKHVDTWARYKLRRPVGQCVNADQKNLLQAFLRAQVGLGEEDRQFVQHILEGAKRQDPVMNLKQNW